ncbi:MAG TPA: hypothetical protein VM223_27965 [Planctomycetota bacterium]|nr:hypothetical protein [Planctomycetota bacterium]
MKPKKVVWLVRDVSPGYIEWHCFARKDEATRWMADEINLYGVHETEISGPYAYELREKKP